MTREQIDQKYIDQANTLEAEFFDIVDEGLPNQHRVLKAGKTEADFNTQHGVIWQNHWGELIANGFEEPIPEPEPVMDYKAEILKLQDEVKKLQSLTAETKPDTVDKEE